MTRQILATMSIVLTMVVYAAGVYANDTVLQLVPEDSTGFVYMGNPMRLSQKIDNLASDMTNSPQQNLLAKILADAFGADFQSLDELYDIGFDLKEDLCISFKPSEELAEELAVITHVHDADGVKALLQEKVGSMEEMKYAGIKYSLGHEGAFAVFDNLFVMANSGNIFKKIIDTYKNKSDSILQSSDYKSLKLDLSEENEVAVFANLDKIVQTYSPQLQELKQKAESALEELPQDKQIKSSVKMTELMMNFGLWIVEQLDLYCLTADLEGSTAQFTEFVKFKDESEIQKYISTKPTDLNLLRLLPHGSFVAGGGVFKKEDWVDFFKMVIDITQKDVEIDSQAYEKSVAGLEEFYAHFGEEIAFACDISSSMMPDFLYIYETEDDTSAVEYMKTGYFEYLKLVPDLYEQMGLDITMGNAMANATIGETETYEGIEIQRINLPNMDKAFADMPEEMKPMIPKDWSIWYAIEDGKMVLAMSRSSEPVKQVVDVMNGNAESIESDESYDKLANSIFAKNNFVAYFSPVMLIKKITTMVSQANPDVGMLAMMFNNLPESYNLVISGISRDKGIEVNTVIAPDDLKQLVQMLVMMSQQR